jgi:hypothetical protein
MRDLLVGRWRARGLRLVGGPAVHGVLTGPTSVAAPTLNPAQRVQGARRTHAGKGTGNTTTGVSTPECGSSTQRAQRTVAIAPLGPGMGTAASAIHRRSSTARASRRVGRRATAHVAPHPQCDDRRDGPGTRRHQRDAHGHTRVTAELARMALVQQGARSITGGFARGVAQVLTTGKRKAHP